MTPSLTHSDLAQRAKRPFSLQRLKVKIQEQTDEHEDEDEDEDEDEREDDQHHFFLKSLLLAYGAMKKIDVNVTTLH